PERLDGRKLIDDVRELVEIPNGFRLEIAPDVLGLTDLESRTLKRIFGNLIDNAIRHHDRPEGVVSVSVQEEPGRWRFRVTDDGPGIAAEYHEKIFDMFQTLQPRDRREGSGLGLAYVKRALSQAGQTIAVEPTPGRGTTFFFTWPKNSHQDQENAS